MTAPAVCRGVGAWLLGLFLGGCLAPAPAPMSPVPAARFVIENLADRPWEIVLTPLVGAVERWRIEPRATVERVLAAGGYQGEQVLLTATGHPVARRTLEVRLEPGQVYRWRLTTLRTAAAPAAGAEAGGGPAGR